MVPDIIPLSKVRGKDEWYIVYHRRPLGETDGNYRITCIDRMYFNKNGTIKPVKNDLRRNKSQPIALTSYLL